MTFLNPIILFGLLAAGIPILLHLLNLRKLRTIEFSTLSFLKELQKTKIRRIKIRQWLLLLLRMLLIMFIVMAFARPTLKGSLAGAFGERANTTSVFILDDSQSMTALDEGGERFAQARNAALQVVDLMKDGDEVFLMKLSDLGTLSTNIAPTRNLELVRTALRESKPSYRHAALEDALRFSARLLAGSTNFNQEVILFSDFQAGSIASKHSPSSAREQLFPESVRLYVVESGSHEPNNLGVESISIPNSIFEAGKPFSVQARVINAGESNIENHIVSLFLNGERVAQKGIDVPPGSATNVDFTAVPKSGGILEGTVELEQDELDFDNRRHFTLVIPERVRLLLVGSSGDLQFIRLALSSREPSSTTALQIRETTPERLSANDVDAADVIVAAGLRGLSAVQASRIESFLDAGGGLIAFPGQQTDQNTYNTGVAGKIGIPQINNIETLQSLNSDTESYITFDRVETRHPLFRGMFEKGLQQSSSSNSGQRTIESPQVIKLVRYQLPTQAQSVITLSNDAPFLAELPVRSGRVLLYGVAALPQWSDFPFKGLFVPLLHRSVSYLAQETAQQKEVVVGEEQVVRSRVRATDRWVVTSPTNIETVVQPASSGAETIVRFNETNEPGVYRVRNGSTTVNAFAVNMYPDESKTARATDEEIQAMFDRLGIAEESIQRLDAGGEIHQQIQEARFGVELWKHFLLAALVVAIAEMLVARDSKAELASVQAAKA
ncbi:MAG: BatA domain-containing protein [Ignavibacteriae bacterium]|nr:BatA domain-containing protein [Ignavibacteriota bacterium]